LPLKGRKLTHDTLCTEKNSEPARQGLVTVFTGDGRGKTTAAIGTAVRAAGHGLRVFIVFFMKGSMFSHGEVQALSGFPGIKTASFGQKGWVKKGENNPEAREQAIKALAAGRQAVLSGDYDLVVLDEINGAVESGLIPLEDVTRLISAKPGKVELILTGRQANPQLLEIADVVTEMRMVKHPFNRGIKARKGIDY
jgi:cob(I)alamin adenosyltransferase